MLRAHLRQCPECSRFARSQRAQRAALRSLAIVPLPETLRSFFGPGGIFGGGAAAGGTAAGVGLAVKAAAVSATALVAGSVATGGANPARWRDDASGSTVAALAAVPAPAAPGAEADRQRAAAEDRDHPDAIVARIGDEEAARAGGLDGLGLVEARGARGAAVAP